MSEAQFTRRSGSGNLHFVQESGLEKAMKYYWLTLIIGLAVATALRPDLDLAVTHGFYAAGHGFPAQNMPLALWIHDLATNAPIWIGLGLLAMLSQAIMRRRNWRVWLFLLLALLIGPGLTANTLLKDNWGRARPLQVREFDGASRFTPWWQPAQECRDNCSFVAGDPSFGFMLAAAGLVASRRRRLWFWGGTAMGVVMGINRIAMGAHFLSDVMCAALVMLAVMGALYAVIFGRKAFWQVWRAL